MKYCSSCGGAVSLRVPDDDNHERHVCDDCGVVHYRNPIPVVGCVAEHDGKVLLCKRAIEPRYGYWTVPAGFMELGEKPEAATLRELREEAGLGGHVKCLLGLRSTPSRLYHTILLAAYVVTPESGPPVAGDDATAARWFRPTDMPPVAFDSHQAFIRQFYSGSFQRPESCGTASPR